MFKRYPQLQSGYLAPNEELVTKPEPPHSTPVTSLVNKTVLRTQQDLFYSPALDKVFNNVIQNPMNLRDLAFLQDVLEKIGKAFGGQSFASFVTLQGENPGISQIHIEFLSETIEVALGLLKQRRVSLETWASLISAANESVGGFKPALLNNRFKDYGFTKMDLAEFVTIWIKNVGWTDFLMSMRVIFGRRTLHGIMGGTLE